MEYLGFLVAIIVLFVILKLLALPLKIIIKLMFNALIGGVVLFLLNIVGARFGLIIDINWISTNNISRKRQPKHTFSVYSSW